MKLYRPRVILQFLLNLLYCLRLIAKPYQAYGFLRSGREPQIGSFMYKNMNFNARKEDWVIIREVLAEDEYSCMDRLFAENERLRILDLGANIGCFALRVFSKYPAAEVVSVEAADDTYAILEQNQKINSSLNWKILNNGIWSADVPLTIMRRGISAGHRVIEGEGEEIIHGISLQTILQQVKWNNIDLIKMDIEGGEEVVIPASTDVLHNTQYLIIEVHNDRIDSSNIISELRNIYTNIWQINERRSSKPLYIMSNEDVEFGTDAWRINV